MQDNSESLDRATLVRRAFGLELLTCAWMTIEAAIAIGAGVAAHSLSLVAFGADSVIELVSAGVLLWRINVEIKHGDIFSEAVEHRASRIGGGLLFVLASYVLASAIYGLWLGDGQEFSLAGSIVGTHPARAAVS